MPDKKLIYFCSWGEQYNQMLHLCIDSLMQYKDIKDEIIVVSNEIESVSRPDIGTIILDDVDGKKHPDISLTAIHKYIDLDRFDFIYYFYHDIIFHRDLNELKTDPEKIILSRASSTTMSSPYIQMNKELLVGRENELAINNGLHIVPKKYSSIFFEIYHQMTLTFNSWGGNAQQALNLMYVTKPDIFDFISPEQIYFPSDPDHSKFTDKTVLTHFAGQSMENRLKQMSA